MGIWRTSLIEGLLFEFHYLQGWILGSTSRGYGWVLSPLFQLEGIVKQQEMLALCMCILLSRYMVFAEALELLYHVDDCVVIKHQVFISDFVLPTNLVDDEFRITACFEKFNLISSASCILIRRTLFSVILLKHGSVNENAWGIM